MMALGVYFAIKGELTIGTVLSFFTIAGYFLDPIGRLVNLQLQIQEASISLKRLGELFEIQKEEDNEKDVNEISLLNGDVNISHISFRYGRRAQVLKDISLDIKQGEKIAFVGESGSGKTTLSKLLLKLYRCEEGSISFDGIDINNINAFSLRKLIGYVPQEIELFSGSIVDNLKVAKEDATNEEIDFALTLSNCDETI